MPSCEITHRVRTGLFTWTLILILGKSAASYRRVRAYRGLKVTKSTIKVTVATLVLTLLLMCGDVEPNPGPDKGGKEQGGDPQRIQQTGVSLSDGGGAGRRGSPAHPRLR